MNEHRRCDTDCKGGRRKCQPFGPQRHIKTMLTAPSRAWLLNTGLAGLGVVNRAASIGLASNYTQSKFPELGEPESIPNLCWTGRSPLFIMIAPLQKRFSTLALASAASFQFSQQIACCSSPPDSPDDALDD